MREFDERFLLKSHTESYIITMQQDKNIIKNVWGKQGERRDPDALFLCGKCPGGEPGRYHLRSFRVAFRVA